MTNQKAIGNVRKVDYDERLLYLRIYGKKIMFGEFRARGFVINFAIDVENNKS
jgi:hypothetical protein